MMNFSMFSQKEIEALAAAAERVLAEAGVRVEHEGIFNKLSSAGALCDANTKIVKFPADLLRGLLSTVPESFDISGINGRIKTMAFGSGPVINGIVTDPWILDYPSGEPRRPKISDVERNIKIHQAVGTDSIYRMVMDVEEFQGPSSQWHALEAVLKNSDRHHVAAPTSLDVLKTTLEIMEVYNGGSSVSGKGMLLVGIPILSPLTFTELYGDLLVTSLEAGCDVMATVCPITGATSPYSKIGSLIQGHAESAAFAAITQLIKPGANVLSMNSPSLMDMSRGFDLYHVMDKLLWKLAAAELFRHQGLLSGSEISGSIPARYDMQTGAESILFMAAAKLCEVPFLSGLGTCCDANGVSAENILIQRSFLNAFEFFEKGFDIGDIEANISSIGHIGPSGNFLTDDMTIERLRGCEFFNDRLFDYSREPDSPSMLERAHRRAMEIERDFVSPVPGEIQDDLTRYFEKLYK